MLKIAQIIWMDVTPKPMFCVIQHSTVISKPEWSFSIPACGLYYSVMKLGHVAHSVKNVITLSGISGVMWKWQVVVPQLLSKCHLYQKHRQNEMFAIFRRWTLDLHIDAVSSTSFLLMHTVSVLMEKYCYCSSVNQRSLNTDRSLCKSVYSPVAQSHRALSIRKRMTSFETV